MYKLFVFALCTILCASGAEWKTAKVQLLKPYIEYSDYDPITGKYGLAAADRKDMDRALKEAQKIAEVEFNVTKVRNGSRSRLWKIDNEEKIIQKAREELAAGYNPKIVSARLGRGLKSLKELSKAGVGAGYEPTTVNVGPLVRALAEQQITNEIKSYAMRPSKQSLFTYFASFYVPRFRVGPFMSKYEPQEMMRRNWYSAASR